MTLGRQHKSEYLVVIISTFVIFFAVQYSNMAERLNFIVYDSLQADTTAESNTDIAIIEVDDKSLEQIGAWPWSRSIHAGLLTRLIPVKPKAVAFDILFMGPDSRNINGDTTFAEAIKNNGHVVLPVLQTFNNTVNLQYPIPTLKKVANQLAHVDAEVDSDGLVRRVFLKAGLNQSNLSALGLAALETAQRRRFSDLPGQISNRVSTLNEGKWVRNNQVLLPLKQAKKRYKTFSYIDVLNNDVLLQQLAEKIIFIGVTATGVATNLPIANGTEHSLISSLFYHAAITEALLNNKAITPAPAYLIYFTGAALLSLLFFTYTYNRPGISLALTFLFSLIAISISLLALKSLTLWIPPAEIIIALLVSYPLYGWRRMILMRKQLSQEKEQAEVTLQSIADGVITLDHSGNILYMNPVAELLTGETNYNAINKPIESVFNVIEQSTGERLTFALLQHLPQKNKKSPHERHLLTNKDGKKYTIRTTVGEIKQSSSVNRGIVLAFSDITETTKLLDYTSHQATHDTLTDLPNRTLLMESLIHSLAVASRNHYQVALLFIDIDKFKNINDGFGHETGDQLLSKIAKRLKASIRDEDTVARLGGDEFVIVLDQILNPENIAIVTRKILKNFEHSILLSDHKFTITCSIGISLFPRDATNAETLLKNADIAMYSAKDRGRNNFQYFSKNMNEIVQNRLLLEKELRIALKQNDLQLFYQPQVNLHSGKMVGVEALLRWNRGALGEISPARFIPLAEDTGLIIPIGEWVLRTACEQLNKWKDFVNDDFSLAINLSPRQFLEQDVLAILKDVIATENIDARRLKLEITEGLFVATKNNIESTLEEFRSMGGLVSIDDFGTGYSSLSYLNRIPVDQVKIDRSFIQKITKNSRGRSLTKAIISMANDMNLDVIAEGVESLEQLNILKSQNCRQAQGFYYSPAVEAEKITEILRNDEPFAR